MRSSREPWLFFLFDFEKVVVVSTLFAIIFSHHVHGFNGPGRDQRDAFHILIEPFFQITHASFDIFPLGFSWFEELILAAERRAGFQQIVEADNASTNQIEDARLKPFGPVILQAFLDGADMSFEVMHVSFERLMRVFA